MKKKRDEAVQQKKILFLAMQHPLIFTSGLLSKEKHVLAKDIKITAARRGGSVTLHNPGQLVFYTLVPLIFTQGLETFIRLLEKSLLQAFVRFGYEFSLKTPHSGIWTEKGKIAFIGLGLKNQCIYHGLAVNLYNDLSPFAKIFSCGLEFPVTRLQDFSGLLQDKLQDLQKQEEALQEFSRELYQQLRKNF